MRISDWSSDVCSSDLAHDIDYPLHSWAIRGARGKFAWLKAPEKAGNFHAAIEEYLLSLPIVALACVINRPGYVARYKGRYNEQLWLMCKTAFSILVERAAKFADDEGRQLAIYFEGAGPKEDRDIEKRSEEHTSDIQSIMRI